MVLEGASTRRVGAISIQQAPACGCGAAFWMERALPRRVPLAIAAIAIHLVYYNFVRIHQTLRVTPAMAAGVTDRLWSIQDLVSLLS
jgi:hypothetical protein